MASSSSSKEIYAIGIELEFLVRLRTNREAYDTREKVADYIVDQYNMKRGNSSPPMTTVVGRPTAPKNYLGWILADDTSIKGEDKVNQKFALELISPIMPIGEGSKWDDLVKEIWEILNELLVIYESPSCATQVHFSVKNGFDLVSVKKIAQCIIQFEEAIEALIPPDRRENRMAVTNWINSTKLALDTNQEDQTGLKGRSRKESMELIDTCKTIDEVADLMNPDDSRWFAWNFLHLKSNYRWAVKDIIEFRRPAASLTADDSIKWGVFTASFAQAACRVADFTKLFKIPRNIGGLKEFIREAELEKNFPGMFNQRYLNMLFQNLKDEDREVPPRTRPPQRGRGEVALALRLGEDQLAEQRLQREEELQREGKV